MAVEMSIVFFLCSDVVLTIKLEEKPSSKMLVTYKVTGVTAQFSTTDQLVIGW
jgi:hypothetical protein